MNLHQWKMSLNVQIKQGPLMLKYSIERVKYKPCNSYISILQSIKNCLLSSPSCTTANKCGGNYIIKYETWGNETLTLYIIACKVYPSYGTSRDSNCQDVIPRE